VRVAGEVTPQQEPVPLVFRMLQFPRGSLLDRAPSVPPQD
jgi:hypothetical protein